MISDFQKVAILLTVLVATGAVFVAHKSTELSPTPEKPVVVEKPVVGAKPEKTIKEQLDGKTDDEKSLIKSTEIVKKKADMLGNYTETKHGTKIEILDIEQIDGGVAVLAKAWTLTDDQYAFGEDGTVEIERFKIYNPPILVEDPNGDIVYESEFFNYTTNELEVTVTKYREDPVEAIRQVISHNVTIVGKENTEMVLGKVGNTTSTFYSGNGDGRLRHAPGGGATWDTVHDATVGNNVSQSTETSDTFAQCSASSNYVIHRLVFPFDTSAIDSGDTVSSATFSWYVTSTIDQDNDGDDFIGIVETSQGSETTLVGADYDNVGAVDSPTLLATSKDITTDITTSQYNDWALNDMSVIKKSGESSSCGSTNGYTCLGLREGHDINDSAIACSNKANQAVGRMSEYGGGDNTDTPKLVVEHAVAGGPSGWEDNIIISQR